MRNTGAIFLLLTLTLGCFGQKNDRFALRSGYVEYSLTGNTTGTKKVWWDNYGEQTCTEVESVTETKMFGVKSREELHSISVTSGDKFWNADLNSNTGQSGINAYYSYANDYAGSMTDAEAKQLEEDILNSLGGERLGIQKFLGYDCEVVKVLGSKSWIYKGVILKSEARILGVVSNETATKFTKNISVPASRFEPLKNVEYSEINTNQGPYYGSDEDMDEEDEEDDIIPLSYSYEKFLKVTSVVQYGGYKRFVTNNSDGEYLATYMKGLTGGLTVMATHSGNLSRDGKDYAQFEQIAHKGKKGYFGNNVEEGGNVLVLEYQNYNMAVTFMASPAISKQELLNFSDCFKF